MTLDSSDTTLALLTEWMPQQRWFAGKGRAPVLETIATWRLDDDPSATVDLHLVADAADANHVLYQVPVVRRPFDDASRAGEIGRTDDAILIDGAADPAFHAVLYRWVTDSGSAHSADGDIAGSSAGAAGLAPTAPASILAGEQSNTSLIYRPEGGATPVICKLFRQVGIGVNPDIELQSALALAGARFVPPVIGTVEGEWQASGGRVAGSLAFAQEFFPAVEDAWRVALRAATDGTPFAAPAAALGRAVAEMLDTLAEVFPTRPATEADRIAVGAGWQTRWDAAIAAVPELESSREGVMEAYAEALAAPWPDLQRVHGDLHLGQVLDVAGRGWVLLDFEGEPLRPIAERRELDLPVRDVAGMLRSFAYAADAVRDVVDVASRRAWAAEARAGFFAGYGEAAASDLHPALLRALEIDKSVYQTVYDARNRPEWTPIPLAAIAELIGR